ncbi:MAG TPA: GNAT family N-acetyltransferase [Candidatus Baltobacteraceae bacterium]|jgi:GNAT superfamily N-acetyltransferase|nr:GNAT family N-acetyltransferase [Candidatus Baltobacteraceae bacterium]
MSDVQFAIANESDVRELAIRRWPDDASRRLYVNLANTAPTGAWVARDEGTAIAIAFAHESEDERYVSELYVEPSFRRMGIGWKLLSEITQDGGDASISGLVEANDPASLAFFLRRGLALQVPVLRVAGAIPREEELARMAAGDYRFSVVPVDPHAQRFALEGLDRDVRGSARPLDHVGFAELASGTAFMLNDECVGYAYVWPDGRIGPIAAASGAYLVQFFAFALASLVHTYGASWCTALVPGNNVRVMRAAVRCGLTLDQVRIFASDQPILDLSRYVGFHSLAF